MADKPVSSWDDVVAYALRLPESEVSTSYGKPAVKVRGKTFVALGREPGSFVAMSPLEEKELLIEPTERPSGRPTITTAGRRCSSATAALHASELRR